MDFALQRLRNPETGHGLALSGSRITGFQHVAFALEAEAYRELRGREGFLLHVLRVLGPPAGKDFGVRKHVQQQVRRTRFERVPDHQAGLGIHVRVRERLDGRVQLEIANGSLPQEPELVRRRPDIGAAAVDIHPVRRMHLLSARQALVDIGGSPWRGIVFGGRLVQLRGHLGQLKDGRSLLHRHDRAEILEHLVLHFAHPPEISLDLVKARGADVHAGQRVLVDDERPRVEAHAAFAFEQLVRPHGRGPAALAVQIKVVPHERRAADALEDDVELADEKRRLHFSKVGVERRERPRDEERVAFGCRILSEQAGVEMLREAEVLPAVIRGLAIEAEAAHRGGCEDQVVGVHRADAAVDVVHQRDQRLAFGVGFGSVGLVDEVIRRDRFGIAIVLRDLAPQPSGAFPVFLFLVEQVPAGAAGGVIVALPARRTVQVEDDVELVFPGHVHGRVEPSKRVGLELERMRVVFEQAVVKGEADAVEAEAADHLEVAQVDPALPEDVHQAVLRLVAEAAREDLLELVLIADIVNIPHPHFEQEPVAEVASAQDDGVAVFVHDPGALGAQDP
ncbi:MAG: hypothetical protein BWY59_02045 [Verrucomicrobia bacterium ADurb.Bin345]|nr:MAG: hypothetical protein BWY59_02045 [Verrucomicrobia bacterium ADurb.Bin345]